MIRFVKDFTTQKTHFRRFTAYFNPLCFIVRSGALHCRLSSCYTTISSTSRDSKWTNSNRRYVSSRNARKNLYTILGIPPKATQAQIKAAYYNLSLKHHPDRHKGSKKSHGIFQEISEAYSVLGSLDSRKQYDRALIVEGILAPEQARPFHAPPKPSASIYDFDEWQKQHYFQSLLRKQRDMRERRGDEMERKSHKVQEGTQRLVCLAVFLAVAVMGLFSQRTIDDTSEETKS